MTKTEIEKIEADLLLEGIFKRYGYDFRNYSRASLMRRINSFRKESGIYRITELLPKLLYDESFFASLAYRFSITVTEMFRDPSVYKTIREKVISFLKTYPFIKVWLAGCATGEEVYSMAIMFKEEGIYDRVQIYATDFNDHALRLAKQGIYSVKHIQQHTLNYQKSGGKESFSNYYHSKYDSVIVNGNLKSRITFANHNLVSDSAFGEMHLILCRNVMIYFDKILQNRVLQLFHGSLIYNGFLCLGSKESLRFSSVKDKFIEFAKKEKIYQKKD